MTNSESETTINIHTMCPSPVKGHATTDFALLPGIELCNAGCEGTAGGGRLAGVRVRLVRVWECERVSVWLLCMTTTARTNYITTPYYTA